MSSPLRTGQILRGRLGTYNISKSLQDTTVWLAKSVLFDGLLVPICTSPSDAGLTTKSRNNANQDVVVKNVSGHPRVQNERDVLRRFQTRSRYIRQMIDEIEEPSEQITIVLEHLEDHLLQASIKRTLNRKEIKFVSRRVLEALNVLHQDGFVHTGSIFACLGEFALHAALLITMYRYQIQQCLRQLQRRSRGQHTIFRRQAR